MKKLLLRTMNRCLSPLMGRKRAQKLFNVMYHLSLRGMNYRNDNMFTNGEHHVMRRIAHHLRNKGPLVIIDCGANVGKYSQQLIKEFEGCDFKVHCLEPVPETFRILSTAPGLNSPRVQLHMLALGASDGEAQMYRSKDTSLLASLYNRDLNYVNMKMEPLPDKIRLQRLGTFCAAQGISKIDFLKLDTEGNEFDILSAAAEMLADRSISFIQFEFGNTCMDRRFYLRDLFRLLSPHYEIYRLLRDGLYHYPQYHADQEVLSLVNFLAVSRNIKGFAD